MPKVILVKKKISLHYEKKKKKKDAKEVGAQSR